MSYKTVFIYFFVSVLPVCMALSGLSNLTPWIDEVMFIDTPMCMGWDGLLIHGILSLINNPFCCILHYIP